MEEPHHDLHQSGLVHSLRQEPGLGRKVLGTAGTWFLFDVVFYGNTLFQPIVVEAAFGNSTTSSSARDMLIQTARNSGILSSIALPGYAVAGLLMGRTTCGCIVQTPRLVMLQGFAAMSILYTTIGVNWNYWKDNPTASVSYTHLTLPTKA